MDDQKNRVHRYLGAEIEVLVKYKCCGVVTVPAGRTGEVYYPTYWPR
jgi:hypothetical protein